MPTITLAPNQTLARRDGEVVIIDGPAWHSANRPTRPRGYVRPRAATNAETLASFGVAPADVISGRVAIRDDGDPAAELGIIPPARNERLRSLATALAQSAWSDAVDLDSGDALKAARLLDSLAEASATHARMVERAHADAAIIAHMERLLSCLDAGHYRGKRGRLDLWREWVYLAHTLDRSNERMDALSADHHRATERARNARKRLTESASDAAKRRSNALAKARMARKRKRDRIARVQVWAMAACFTP